MLAFRLVECPFAVSRTIASRVVECTFEDFLGSEIESVQFNGLGETTLVVVLREIRDDTSSSGRHVRDRVLELEIGCVPFFKGPDWWVLLE